MSCPCFFVDTKATEVVRQRCLWICLLLLPNIEPSAKWAETLAGPVRTTDFRHTIFLRPVVTRPRR